MLEPVDLILSALAVYRLAVFIGEDAFPPVAWLREKILTRWPSEDTTFGISEVEKIGDAWFTLGGHEVIQDPGRPGQFMALGPFRWSKVITCVWCSSIWIAGGAVAAVVYAPIFWGYASLILALSAAAGLLESWRQR